MDNLKQPKVDIKEIQERANAAAQKAYLDEIERYYTSYDSPYKKMIKEELSKQKFKYNMELPDILDKVNEALCDEVDKIANNAIATSFIPMVNKALTGMDKHINLSFLLQEIINELDPDEDEDDEFRFHYKKHDEYDWLNCTLNTPKNYYEFTLHTANEGSYQLLSFPYSRENSGGSMYIYKDDIKIEMPFTRNVLSDKVLRIFFKMMISNSHIKMDCDDFREDMFPDRNQCHC